MPVVGPCVDTAIGNHTLWIAFVRPEVDQVAAVAHPLVEDAGGEILVQAKFQVDMRVEGLIRLAEQPSLPICVFFAQFGFAVVQPLLPLHITVLFHLI